MDDGYLLYVDLHWENSGFDWVGVPEAVGIHVSDASGQPISFDVTNDDTTASSADQHQTLFALKTAPVQTAGPLTLTLDLVPVELPVKASFSFEPGPDPQPGQVWGFNQFVDVGYGKSLRVLKASYPTPPVKGMPQQTGLSFDMTSDTGLTEAILMDTAHPVAGGGGGGGGSFAGTFSSGFSYGGDFPSGPITVDIQAVSFSLSGQWQAQWTPPVTEPQITPTAQLSACLTRQSWEQALRKNIPLPAGLTGSLALSNIPAQLQLSGGCGEPGRQPSKRDGLWRFALFFTGWFAGGLYRPDANGPPNGIYITDLATGDITQLAGTIRGDSAPLWSPDGTHIAFTRGPASGLIGAPAPTISC